MDRSQERRTKRPAEYIDDTGHESKKAKRRRELWGSLPSPSGLLFERGHSPLGCCFGWQGSHSATRRPEERQTSDVSSFHLQLLDGGTTTKTRHRAPVQANIRAKIERDVGDDAERANVRAKIEHDMGGDAERARRHFHDVLHKHRDRERLQNLPPCGWGVEFTEEPTLTTEQIRHPPHEAGPESAGLSDGECVGVARSVRSRLQTDHGLHSCEVCSFLRHDLPAGGEESVPTKYLRFARNNPNLDLDPSHFDWIISALGRR
ncbi:hypothetical protein LTR91_023556 [Friedmanniomyces endolithicus]|uniref:Uncharacterized protein n=1 Tax=Friedmanniomyces endolithicus TaxID=329885 RepID=A0AAN6H4A0_9PEZI|nr:hypothetical protein LTS09_003829 [Friedmanniomyces endolithicus]KAK0271477.1 hypothetical protein LTR35_013515 [Friedmanniomyces endolithicus]KAK0280601.1 hypothetical protein LTS00_013030 [Friedmanniomyces endolithicus]KAK0315704.1 hypothetical protein LTR01_001004 [Friedmanniomyces endolithicus]KAK0320582.1 hypothetical protein LTR82_008295 [Friedmanniomyces endolithicus]